VNCITESAYLVVCATIKHTHAPSENTFAELETLHGRVDIIISCVVYNIIIVVVVEESVRQERLANQTDATSVFLFSAKQNAHVIGGRMKVFFTFS